MSRLVGVKSQTIKMSFEQRFKCSNSPSSPNMKCKAFRRLGATTEKAQSPLFLSLDLGEFLGSSD